MPLSDRDRHARESAQRRTLITIALVILYLAVLWGALVWWPRWTETCEPAGRVCGTTADQLEV